MTTNEVRIDFIPTSDYISREFQAREKERLWPRVWQVACREEEIANVGDYVTFDVGDESLVVVRTAPGQIKSFYNVCLHRGRRLKEGCGKMVNFTCRFHGWQWDIDGQILRVLDREDWGDCLGSDADLKMQETLVDTWGGFVFVNMNLQAESLQEFLSPVPDFLDPFEFGKMRYRWYKSVKLPTNWKVALEGFSEGYHVAATHPQILDNLDDVTRSFTYGKHGMFDYSTARPFGGGSARLGKPCREDLRHGILGHMVDMAKNLQALAAPRSVEAAHRLWTELPDNPSHMETLLKLREVQIEAGKASGAGWPDITMEQLKKAGADWHIFPNLVTLMRPDGALVYRARPDGDDPDSCIFDIWSLVRYAPNAEPPLKRELFHGKDDYKTHDFGQVLNQDFSNLGEVQKGMKSRGFPGARPSPLQESVISNHHRVIHEYLYGDA
jgi:phenylpropionate dioxygenase-like ring-hydroxylating dioxygenase large terminal subunit